MKAEEDATILGKVNDLSGYLESSRKSIPFMEDILAFVRDMVPVVEELKKSIALSSDKLPTASKQLDKVTSATEMASTEILNIVEGILARIDAMQTSPVEESLLREIDRCIAAVPAQERAPLAHAWNAFQEFVAERNTECTQGLTTIQDDCTSIMIALQVQDITAQQIAAVNRLMASVDEGFTRLMKHLADDAEAREGDRFKHRNLDIVFDPNAEYGDREARQHVADAVVEQTQEQQAKRKG